MTRREWEEWCDSDYKENDYHTDKRSDCARLADALPILLQITDGGDLGADHDVIYLGGEVDPEKVTLELVKKLYALGMSYDTNIDRWVMSV